jgi:hypothetical protein
MPAVLLLLDVLVVTFAATPALAAPMSGPKDRPRPGDSRYPGETPRPTGAVLLALPAGVTLEEERLEVRCRFRGGGCRLRQHFRVVSATAQVATVRFATPALSVGVRLDGRHVDPRWAEPPARPVPWRATGRGVDPERGVRYRLPGAAAERASREGSVEVTLPAGARRTLTVVTNSVGGFDRIRRQRTAPEVGFAGIRRRDAFVHHHELRRRPPDGSPVARPLRPTRLTLDVPRSLLAGASVPLRCQRDARRQICQGEVPVAADAVQWSVAERHRRPVGLSAGAGVAFNNRGAEALLRAAVSLLVRRRRDLVTLAAETDARSRVALALTYELLAPFQPHAYEIGFGGELGLVLDVYPEARPAIRAGATVRFSIAHAAIRFDLYPGEIPKGGGAAWRGLLVLGIGL